MERTISGRCLCGESEYRTEAEPINIRMCHCELCQKATGAPFFARVLVPLDTLKVSGPVRWHNSSPELRRGFCGHCGTALFSERASRNVIGISLASLDHADAFAPQEHIWASRKRAWLRFDDGLPVHEGPAPE